jgi:hypothetical protein
MDISNIQATNHKVALRHPGTGEDLGLVFEMRSRHSKEVKRVNERFEQKHTGRRAKEPSPAEKRQHSKELIVASVAGWEWTDPDLVFEGEQPEYSADVLKKWLKDYPWMLEFFSEEFIDDANFFMA